MIGKQFSVETMVELQNRLTQQIFSMDDRERGDVSALISLFSKGEGDNGIRDLIIANHVYNAGLWSFEDQARDPIATDSKIALVKRAIDALNQKRNDQIELINLWIQSNAPKMNEDAVINTETPGSVADRLSILSLKKYHMLQQIHRDDVDETHANSCQEKLKLLESQGQDLMTALTRLFQEIAEGKRCFKLYFQVKMYNDPNLNPYLYNSCRAE